MKRSSLAIAGLGVALAVSNAAWLYAWVNAAVGHSYLEDSYTSARGTAKQALALLPEVARPGATKESVIAAASRGVESGRFEKDGFTWLGDIGLKFDDTGVLIDARPSVDPL